MIYDIIFGERAVVIPTEGKREAIIKLSSILECTANFCLISKLNEMQMESCNYDGSDFSPKTPWDNKWTIPDYFINLVLSPYNCCIEKRK